MSPARRTDPASTASTVSTVRVPALLQPANAPLPFVGRARERERLVALLERGSVAVVCGFSGVGKSGLLLSVLATRFAAERERTLVVDAKESADVVGAALHALDRMGARTRDTRDVDDGARELVGALEAHELWLLVENLERVDERTRALLELALRFCRRARVLCVCREDPRMAALAAQTVTVGPMSAAELRGLLDEVQPGLSDAEAAGIVAHAKGSPWRLRQLSLGGAVDEEGPEKSLLMLAPIAVGLLRTLAVVPASVPRDVLARATRLPADDAIESLARRGYLELSARGIRVHDAARPLVEALFDDDDRAARTHKLVKAIVESGSAELGLSALALIRATRDATSLAALLDKHGDALRADGHAAALLDVVTELGGAPLAAWGCRLALDVGGDALARAPVIDGADVEPRALALSAAVLAARGELTRARALAERAASSPRADLVTKLDALDVLQRAAGAVPTKAGDTDSRALLARALGTDAGAQLTVAGVDGARAAALALTLGLDVVGALDAPSAARDLVRRYESLPAPAQLETAALVARALHHAGDPRVQAAVLARAPAPCAALSTSSGRAAELERGHTALALADLAAARAHFDRAASFPSPLERAEARVGVLAVRLAAGELRGLDVELAAVVAVLQEREAPPFLSRRVDALRTSLAALAGQGARKPPALAHARKARAAERDAGRALEALHASVACIDAALIEGDRASVAVEAEQLARDAERIGSRRFALDARFASLDLSSERSSQALVELAQVTHENPVVARRAAALLGERVPLDAVDEAVLAALAPATGAQRSVVREAAGPEWTVDVPNARIILVDGSTVDLATRRVLLDLLATLCANGGAATKEQLLERAWGVREYHPLHHDNRLKVAVRKLRRLLEETLGADPIETAPDGYRLRGKVRFLK